MRKLGSRERFGREKRVASGEWVGVGRWGTYGERPVVTVCSGRGNIWNSQTNPSLYHIIKCYPFFWVKPLCNCKTQLYFFFHSCISSHCIIERVDDTFQLHSHLLHSLIIVGSIQHNTVYFMPMRWSVPSALLYCE